MTKDIELEVWQRVAGLAQSPSHDFRHIERVQSYVEQLGAALGVETELVRIAAILHDLGRGDQARRHGIASIEASKEMAEEVLRNLDLPPSSRKAVVEAIESHDQPGLSPEAVTGRILKDADFLAGFGAWGVLRIAMWSGETGRRIDDVIQRMTDGMRRRLDSLEYSYSRDAALREILFARQFQGELARPAMLKTKEYRGFYLVIEGISGVGKNTIADAICEYLTARKVPHCTVEEPGDTYRALRQRLPGGISEAENPPLEKALLIADRAEQFQRCVRPSLVRGEVVVSVRSCLSTAVYQCSDDAEAFRTLLEHDWLPPTDLLVLLDVDADTALSRICKRKKPAGRFETRDLLCAHRLRYLAIAGSFPSRHTEVIDASVSEERVKEEVLLVLEERLAVQFG